MASLMRSAAEPWSGEFCASPLPERAHVEVAVLDFGDVPAPLEDRLHVALAPSQLDLRVEEGPNAGKALEVAGDECLRLVLGNAELTAQRERPLAVDGGEVDRLRAARISAVTASTGRRR